MEQPPVRFLLVGAFARSLINFRAPLLRGLRAAGCEVHAAANAVEEDREVIDQLERLGTQGHSVPLARAGLNPVTDIRSLVALVRLMRRIRPTIMMAYTIKPVIWGVLAAWIAGVPQRYAMITGLGYAFAGEATGKRGMVQQMARALYRIALSRAHMVFFQNPDDLALFRYLGLIGSDQATMLINGSGVDLAHYEPQPLPKGPIRFLMIARLLGDKGVREYVKAATMVRLLHPRATFHLVGGCDPNPDAVAPDELNTWIESGNIIWHGTQSDVRPFLADCHVFVLPSYREGTPRTVLEAMATGRPIITTNAPGCRETVVDGGNGYLVPPRDAEALARAMLIFLETPSLIGNMSEKSLVIVKEKYSADKVTAMILNAIDLQGN